MAANGQFRRAAALIGLFCGMLFMLASAFPAPAQPLSQGTDEMPHVVFIEEPRDLAMASVTDTGPDGLTRLADLFRDQGALVEWIRLRDDISADVDVIVLVRPRRALGAEDLARIWKQVGAGASLLVAVDPNGFQGGTTESERGGLSTLTTLDQGITLREGILIEPWFTHDSWPA
ncbi:MAG: hypothetical protein IPK19_28995 [Chloroflexi bacterium]|nr:hypothetical protein [Chloroflexota bacterium]